MEDGDTDRKEREVGISAMMRQQRQERQMIKTMHALSPRHTKDRGSSARPAATPAVPAALITRAGGGAPGRKRARQGVGHAIMASMAARHTSAQMPPWTPSGGSNWLTAGLQSARRESGRWAAGSCALRWPPPHAPLGRPRSGDYGLVGYRRE